MNHVSLLVQNDVETSPSVFLYIHPLLQWRDKREMSYLFIELCCPGMIHRPAASASLGTLLESRIPGPTPTYRMRICTFYQNPRWFNSALMFEKKYHRELFYKVLVHFEAYNWASNPETNCEYGTLFLFSSYRVKTILPPSCPSLHVLGKREMSLTGN